MSSADVAALIRSADMMCGMCEEDVHATLEHVGGDMQAAGEELLATFNQTKPLPRREPAADAIAVPTVVAAPTFGSNDARQATLRIFAAHVEPSLPQLDEDGALRGGDPAALDAMLSEPIVITPPRAEAMALALRPSTGWTPETKLQARDCFATAAAGLRFAAYLPAVTHRCELERSPLFQVKDDSGKVVGVRYACPRCKTNAFTVCDGYTLRNTTDASKNGIRFIFGIDGVIQPFGQQVGCRNAACPPIARALAKRGLAWPDPSRPLPPKAKAPDGKPWPEASFKTTFGHVWAAAGRAPPHLGCGHLTLACTSRRDALGTR